nr:hypothetical protein Iba_chr04dCG17870 [Ipomoea batatas]
MIGTRVLQVFEPVFFVERLEKKKVRDEKERLLRFHRVSSRRSLSPERYPSSGAVSVAEQIHPASRRPWRWCGSVPILISRRFILLQLTNLPGSRFIPVVHFTVERKTVFPIDALDMSKLSLFDEDRPLPLTNGIEALDCSEAAPSRPRSVSKRSNDRSDAYEVLLRWRIGDCRTCSVVSESARNLSWERDSGSVERESSDCCIPIGDEFDEEEEDQRLLEITKNKENKRTSF